MRLWVRGEGPSRLILWSLVIAFTGLFSTLSIARHRAFYSLEDAGAFSQMLWTTLHGRLFYTDVPGLGRFAFTPHNYLGEHFSPILFLLIPLYALWPAPETLLLLQAVFLGVAAVPLYMLIEHRFNHRPLALSFAVAWLISPYVWQSSIADFHLDTFEPVFIFSAAYCLLKRRIPRYLIFIILSLLCKEDTFIYVIGLGAFAMLAARDMKTGAATIGIGLVWGISTFKLFMPFFGGGIAYLDHYSQFGHTLPEILETLVSQPGSIIMHLSQAPIRNTILWIFLTVGFLPLLSPTGLLLLSPSTLERLLTNRAHINTLSWSYSMGVLPLLFVASIEATSNIIGRARDDAARQRCLRGIAILLIGAALIGGVHFGFGFTGFVLRMPPPVISKQAWLWVTRRDTEVRQLLAGIPESASVSTSPFIVPHVSHRFDIRVYPYRPLDRDIILLDVYGEKHPADLEAYKCEIVRLLSGREYGVVEYLDGFLYLRRGEATSRNSAVAERVASIFEPESRYSLNGERVFDADAGDKHAVLFSKRRRSSGVVYGPYVPLPPGLYDVVFRLKVGDRTPGPIARLDVSADHGSRILAERLIKGADFREAGTYEGLDLGFRTEERLDNVEFRVHRYAGHEMWIDRINLYPEHLALEAVRHACQP